VLDAVVLALALAMDATAVAAARGMADQPNGAAALRLALVFGAFQGGFAALGWAGGTAALRVIEAWGAWLAFAVLAAIGLKMIAEAARRGDAPAAPRTTRLIVLLAVATSIDALAAGISIPLLAAPPPLTIALIAGVTVVLSLAGGYLGRTVGARLGRGLELAGGLALIAIGVKILVTG
jgi:manganese efflux pump family protein